MIGVMSPSPLIGTYMPTEPEELRASFERDALPHLDAMYRSARRLTGSAADADDLVQDAMLAAYRAWHQFRPGSNAKAWLLTILRHAFVNEYRRRTARRDSTPLDVIEGTQAAALHGDADPEGAFFEAQIDERVARAVAGLPAAYREVFVLTDIEDLRYEDAARVLNVPIGTIRSRLFRARQILRSKLMTYAVTNGWIKEPERRRGAA